jgi:branched-chain amino acid transport system permease protein
MASQKLKILIVVICLAALAFIVPHSGSFVVLLATRAMAFAILAMSVDLLLGYTGLSSMGQAAYFGVGAYLTAVLATKVHFGLGSARRSRRCSDCSPSAPAASTS